MVAGDGIQVLLASIVDGSIKNQPAPAAGWGGDGGSDRQSRRQESPQISEREALLKLRGFRKEFDEFSKQRWDGHYLKALMEWVCGYQITDRTFTRWKRVAGIEATKKLYGNGSFVLAAAIAQLKKDGVKAPTSIDVLYRVEKIDREVGVQVWLQEVADIDRSGSIKGEKILGAELPKEVKKRTGIERGESYFYKNVPNYARKKEYSVEEVVAITTQIQKKILSDGRQNNGRRAKSKTTQGSPQEGR